MAKYTEEQKAAARLALDHKVREMIHEASLDAIARLEKLMDDDASGLLETELEGGAYEASKNFMVALGHHLIWAYGKPYAKNDRKWLNKIKKLKLKI
jgi:uncharacterized Zn finger protein